MMELSLLVFLLLGISSVNAIMIPQLPLKRCRDGTVIISLVPVVHSPTFPGGDPCAGHGGNLPENVGNFKVVVDCRKAQMCEFIEVQDKEEKKTKAILGFPMLQQKHFKDPSLTGVTHNIILNMILTSPGRMTRKKFVKIGNRLMAKYSRKRVMDSRRIVSHIWANAEKKEAKDLITPWRNFSKGPNKKKYATYTAIGEILSMMETTVRDGKDYASIIEDIESNIPKAEAIITDALKDDGADKKCAECAKAMMRVFSGSYSYWSTENHSRRLAGSWPWEQDAVTALTTAVHLCGFGVYGLAGGVVAGALASAGTYYRW